MKTSLLLAASTAALLCSCGHLPFSSNSSKMNVTTKPFGTTKKGQTVELYTLTNATGASVDIMTLGGTITSIKVPDRKGHLGEVVLGFDNLHDYEEKSPFFGCITGRYANRIAKGRFTLDGSSHMLATNNGPNHLHGGKVGFDKMVWQAKPLRNNSSVGLELTHTSPDGDEGYPGALFAKVTYTWDSHNELTVQYEATTTKPTVLNLTNHSYFNLADAGASPVLNHQLTLHAGAFTPTDATAIPTGEIRQVAGTPFDFTAPHTLGERINANDQQIKYGLGYDHNFIVDGRPGHVRPCASVYEPTTGRVLTIETDQPAVQLYTGNFLDGIKGRNGATYSKRHAVCLETQHYPDSPNQPAFPSTVLRPGETFESTTTMRFSTHK